MASICVVGAGLNGTMIASLLVKLGYNVTVFEKRADPRVSEAEAEDKANEFGTSTSPTRRTINLALSHRGMVALKEIGLLDPIMTEAIRMSGRAIHGKDGSIRGQAYGKPDEAIWSVSRELLNNSLLNKICGGNSPTPIYFGYSLINANKSGECSFRAPDGSTKHFNFDLIIGADGAYSSTRECMLRNGRINFARRYVTHGYKELNIPAVRNAKGELDFALSPVEALHIWPRGEFMMIALPNPDKSFTATLFAPYSHPQGGFDAMDPADEGAVRAHFEKYFPDAVPLMPELTQDYRVNPVGSLVTAKVDPWNSGALVLIGDAAHAVVPFFGQGMNAGFEDCMVLYDLIRTKKNSTDLKTIAAEFSKLRIPPTSALSDLCVEHFHDMSSNTASSLYLLRKRLESFLNWACPTLFTPLYTMISFTSTPYDVAIAKARTQDAWIDRGLATLGILGLAAGFGFAFKTGALRPLRQW